MQRLSLVLLLLMMPLLAKGEEAAIDLERFAMRYFEAFVNSQQPSASEEALDHYLKFLAKDIGHTHLPWQTDDSRLPDGRARMREGMLRYLGSHTHYDATLLDVFAFNDSAVAIRYSHSARGIHPDRGQQVEYSTVMMEVLEIEDGHVAVIRKYHE